jgi:hypothetical protein
MARSIDPMHRKLNAADQARYDRFESGFNEVKDLLWTLYYEIVEEYPGGSDALGDGLRARICNDLGLLAEDIRHDLEYELMGFNPQEDEDEVAGR